MARADHVIQRTASSNQVLTVAWTKTMTIRDLEMLRNESHIGEAPTLRLSRAEDWFSWW
ncbi:MAG: hypothetical protein AAF415_18480 [Pseudomonadota bacterium]